MNTILINRSQFIELSNTAYQVENFAFAKRIIISWLKKYPSDLWIQYRLAIILYKLGLKDEAIRLSEIIVDHDPEFIEVWALLAALYPDASEQKKVAIQRQKILNSFKKQDIAGQTSKNVFFRKKESIDIDDLDDFDILSAIRIIKKIGSGTDLSSCHRLLKIYTRRWPKAVQFRLMLGDVLNRMGNSEEGIQIIHATLENDLIGQVAYRLWKSENPYKDLWLDSDQLTLDISTLEIPAKVAKHSKLDKEYNLIVESENDLDFQEQNRIKKAENTARTNLNTEETFNNHQVNDPSIISQEDYLDSSTRTTEKTKEPDREQSPISKKTEKKKELYPSFFSIKGDIKNLIKKNEKKIGTATTDPIKEYVYKLNLEDADERFPVYVVLSTISGLTAKYGKNNKDFIDQEMRSVVDAVENREGWNAMVYYPDEFQSRSMTTMSAESIRASLIQLDQSLSAKGLMIGALLIVGGHDVVPFFTLNNPAMDDDLKIYSDVPYASSDSICFYDQHWQIGRIPGDNSNDPGLLLSQLREIQNHHMTRFNGQKSGENKNGINKQPIIGKFSKVLKSEKCFGYSCAVWQRPSVAVYKNLTDASNLLISPATMASNFPLSRLENVDYAYFNLHGIKGQPNWYGQKDTKDTSSIPMIPVALEISNARNITKTPKVVFAENCYGSDIINRNESNALSLHMLGKTTHVFIGSTAIAYGAMNLPLTAADLLANLFWKHLLTGISCGEAFRRARKNLATEIESSNGSLDGEVQKTLLSFVLLGDPLYAVDDYADITDRMQRAKTSRNYELAREKLDSKVAIDFAMAKRIYNEVNQMYNLNVVSDEFSTFTIQKQIINRKSGGDLEDIEKSQNYVIVYSKDTKVGNMLDRLITRVTVNREGKIIKVSFSR